MNDLKLSKEDYEKVLQILKDKGVDKPCSRCNRDMFSLIDSVVLTLPADSKESIYMVVLICLNCGYVFHHALGVLGFAPQK